MAVVRQVGKPDFFQTFTCNPNWTEIVENLMPGESPQDRPDLVNRVFRLKLEELKKDLFKRKFLGRTVAHIYVIEFQKRGLPHAHILIVLAPEDKLKTADDIDKYVCAEIPNPTTQPLL